MKKIVCILTILMLCMISFGYTSAFDIEWGNQATYSNLISNTLRKWAEGMDGRVGGLATTGTGSIFYVDSNVSAEGDGSSWINAKNTLDEAINLCTASAGDVIYVAQGHTETITASSGIDADVAGITIIGCGSGDLRPTFTFGTAATADMDIDADDIYIYNCIFQSGLSTLATCITITNDDVTIDHCTFRDSTSGLGQITIGAADGDSDRCQIINCQFYSPGTTNDHSIEILFDMVGIRIANNIFHGDYDEAAIYIPAGGNACLDLVIADNFVTNIQASAPAISINGTTTTGVLARNFLYTDTIASALDPGALKPFENYVINTVDLSAIKVPVEPALSVQTKTAGSAEDILAKLYYAADGTGVYPATIATDSALSKIMVKAATPAITAYDNQTDSLEAISDKAGAYTADGGTDNNDSVKADIDLLQVSDAPSKNHPNYFIITADMTSVTWNTVAAHEIVTVTGACRVQIMVETTATIVTTGTNGTMALGYEGNTSAIFSATALDAALTGDVWSAVYGSAATTPASGADAQSALTHGIFDVVVVTGKDIGYTIATNAATTGTLTFHVWWTPLDSTGACAAGAGGAL